MSQRLIHRVADDLGPPIVITHHGVNVTGWTITARFKKKKSGALYTIAATIDAVGDGADVPAQYHFDFVAGNLTAGDQEFDFNYSAVAIDDYSLPAKKKLILTVRDA